MTTKYAIETIGFRPRALKRLRVEGITMQVFRQRISENLTGDSVDSRLP